MSRSIKGLLIVGLLASGCAAPAHLATPVAPLQPLAPIAEGLGRAQVSIHWPETARQVQMIPTSASLAHVEVFDASDSVVASASVERGASLADSTVALDLPVGSDHYLTVTLDAPPVPRVAIGRSLAFEVRRNQTVSVPVTVAPVIKTFYGPLNAYSTSGGSSPLPGFATIWSLAVGADDTLYYPDFSNHAIRSVRQDGTMRVVLGQVTDTSTQSQGVPSTASPDNSGDGGPATGATCKTPHSIYMAPSGDLYFADSLSAVSPRVIRLRMIAASNGVRFGAERQAGYVYTLRTLSTPQAASGLVLDSDGSLLYCEQGANSIWRMTPDGSSSVFIGNATGSLDDGLSPPEVSLSGPWGLTIDQRNNLYYSEWSGSRVRMLCRTEGTYFGAPRQPGKVYTIMDGVGVKTQFGLTTTPKARQLAVDRQGNVFFVDNISNSVFRIASDGVVTRLAGGTKSANNSLEVGDEGLAASASFNLPQGIALDSHNRLYVGDTSNGRIRWIHL